MKLPHLKQRSVMVLSGMAAVLVALGFVAFRMGPLAPTKITVTHVQSESLRPSIYGIGNVEAQQSWLMGPTVAGRVLRVHVDVGQHVKAGQLLAEMDPIDLDQRVQAQQAALNKAASIEAAATAQLADAKARRELASTNLNRQKELARQNFISPAALDGREQEWQSAQAAWQAAQANLFAAQQDAQRLKAEHAGVTLQRKNSRLLAPGDAVVISRDAEPGSTVVAGQPVLRLANPTSLWVKLRVDQARSSGLAAGLSAQIVLRSQPQQVLAGRVHRVEWQADPVTEERVAQVAFEHIPPAISIGEMAEVTLHMAPLAQTLTVPLASVQRHQGQTGVWRLKNQQLDFVPVQWGASSLEGQIQALTGLTLGDTVVVYSEKPLSAGNRFRVVDALVKKDTP